MVFFLTRLETQFVSVLNHFFNELRTHSVQNVEEVVSVWEFARRKSVREITHDSSVFLELGKEILHRQLVVFRNVDLLDVAHLEQLLVLGKNLTQEVFGDHGVRRQIPLDCTQVVSWGEYLRDSLK